MKKLITRFMTIAVLAGMMIGITAFAADANPPRRNKCYTIYHDGYLTVSTYRYLRQTPSKCYYSKWNYDRVFHGDPYKTVISVNKVSVYR
jgi:hypothetical protein